MFIFVFVIKTNIILTKINQLLSKSCIIAIVLGLFISSSCRKRTITTPAESIFASGKLGYFSYNCGNYAPGYAVFKGLGGLSLTITGANVAQYSLRTTYTPSTYTLPQVSSQNNTSWNQANHYISHGGGTNSDIINFQVPVDDAYQISLRYTEYGFNAPVIVGEINNALCSNPTTPNNQYVCFKWIKVLPSIASGSPLPSYYNGFSVIIGQPDIMGDCTQL